MKVCTKCGVKKPISDYHFHATGRDGLRAQCKSCVSARRKIYAKDHYQQNKQKFADYGRKYYRENPRSVLRHALANARRRGRQVSITVDDLLEMWDAQGGCCALSGLSMTWGGGPKGRMPHPTSVSIDRIDQTKGYEKGNVRLLAHCINLFRGSMGDAEMFSILTSFYRYVFGGKQDSYWFYPSNPNLPKNFASLPEAQKPSNSWLRSDG